MLHSPSLDSIDLTSHEFDLAYHIEPIMRARHSREGGMEGGRVPDASEEVGSPRSWLASRGLHIALLWHSTDTLHCPVLPTQFM